MPRRPDTPRRCVHARIVRSVAVRGVRPGHARPRRRGLRRRRGGARRARTTSRPRGTPGCASRSSPTTPPGRPSAVAEHLRELGVSAEERDVVTSAQAAARLLVDRLGGGARGRAARRRRAGGGAARRGPEAGDGARRGRGDRQRLRAGRGVARHHAGRRPHPGRPAVGGQQHRPHVPDGVRRRARARRTGGDAAAGSAESSRWSPASRSVRCSTRPCAGWAASGR